VAIKYDGYLNVLFVQDISRARDFYQNVMGLEYKGGEHDDDAYFQLGPDGLLLIGHDAADELISPSNVDHEPARGARSVLATRVDNVDVAYEELRAKGVEFIRAPEFRPWGLRCAHFKDPDGNVWEIHTPVPGH
jgi:catechol 2,3-dioxygenase-like lactoylglutathione lyase family enzyme